MAIDKNLDRQRRENLERSYELDRQAAMLYKSASLRRQTCSGLATEALHEGKADYDAAEADICTREAAQLWTDAHVLAIRAGYDDENIRTSGCGRSGAQAWADATRERARELGIAESDRLLLVARAQQSAAKAAAADSHRQHALSGRLGRDAQIAAQAIDRSWQAHLREQAAHRS